MIIDHVTIRDLLNINKFITRPIFFEDELIIKKIPYCLFRGHVLIIGYSIETNYGIHEFPYLDNNLIFLKKKLNKNLINNYKFFILKNILFKKNIPYDIIKIINKLV
jgi:hypothetical protein